MTLATYIRDQVFQRLTTGTIANNWRSTRKVPIPTTQGDQLPCLAAYLTRETMSAVGDGNVTVGQYYSEAVVGVSLYANAVEALDTTIDTDVDALIDLIQDALMQDDTFVNLQDPTGSPLLDSIPLIQRTYHYPQSGEFYLIEARLSFTFKFQCYFEPTRTTALTEVDVAVTNYDDPTQPGHQYSLAIPLDQ